MPYPNSARRRSKTMAFRMTPEEYEEVITLAKLSGMNRQDFIMSRLRGIEITVEPSTRVYKALKDSMAENIPADPQNPRRRRAGPFHGGDDTPSC